MVVLGRLAFDLYLPALPLIQQQLQGSGNGAQFTISLFTLGFGISQLFYGPLSDFFGRRLVLLTGILIFIIGSMASFLVTNFFQLIIARFVMGVGAGSGIVISRAMSRDLFVCEQLAEVSAIQSLVLAMSLFIAPVVGGYLMQWFSWRSDFLFLVLVGSFAFVVFYYFLPETSTGKARSTSWFCSAKYYLRLIRTPDFICNALLVSLASAGFVTYFQLSPFIFQVQFHLTAISYSHLFFLIGFVFFAGSWAVKRMVKRYSAERMIRKGCLFLIISGALIAVAYGFHCASIYLVVIASMLYVYGVRFIMAAGVSACLSPFGEIAGVSAALLGALVMLLSSVVSYLVSLFSFDNILLLGIVYLACGLLSLALQHLSVP